MEGFFLSLRSFIFLCTAIFLLLGYWITNLPYINKPDGTPYSKIAYRLSPERAFKLPESGPGSIELVHQDQSLSIDEYLLSNGMRVLVKYTEFYTDDIVVLCYANNGFSGVSPDELLSARLSETIMEQLWLGEVQDNELTELLAYRSFEFDAVIGPFSRRIWGECTPGHLDALLHFIHLFLSRPPITRIEYQSNLPFIRKAFNSNLFSLEKRFESKFNQVNCNRHPLFQTLKPYFLDLVNFEITQKFLQQAFTHPEDFTVFISGHLSRSELTQLLKTHLASIPKGTSTPLTPSVYPAITFPSESVKKRYHLGPPGEDMVTYTSFGVKLEANYLEVEKLNLVNEVIEVCLREAFANAYQDSFGLDIIGKLPAHPLTSPTWVTVIHNTPTGFAEPLKTLVFSTLKRLMESGPTQEELEKGRSNLLEQRKYWNNTHHFWTVYLMEINQWKEPYSTFFSSQIAYKMTREDIRTFIQSHFNLETYTLIEELPGEE